MRLLGTLIDSFKSLICAESERDSFKLGYDLAKQEIAMSLDVAVAILDLHKLADSEQSSNKGSYLAEGIRVAIYDYLDDRSKQYWRTTV